MGCDDGGGERQRKNLNLWTKCLYVMASVSIMRRIIMIFGNSNTLMTLFLILICIMDRCCARSKLNMDVNDPMVIETTKGKVRGLSTRAANGRRVDAFLGIPFAKPPMGELRFRHPKPVEPWEGILNATKKSRTCYQVVDEFFGKNFAGSNIWNPNTQMHEDCLYLNVWVPSPRPSKGTLSVLVWIYGGGFYSGSSTLDVYDGRILASEENIIVVSMNYRLASLGFLYISDRYDAPGNAGMFDQIMALQWVRDNIERFGGLATNVTIFGESAGAVSCSMHMISPLSRNLFSNVILQSGSAVAPWALTDRKIIEKRAQQLAVVVDCKDDSDDMDAVMKCLRKVHPSQLVNNEYGAFGVVEFSFTPIIDGAFLDELPWKSIRKGNIKKTNLMLGSNTEEGMFWNLYFLSNLFNLRNDGLVTRKQFIEAVKTLNPTLKNTTLQAIVFQYTDWLKPDSPESNRDAIDKMVGDYNFNCPVNDFAYEYAKNNNNVYLYYYTHPYSTQPYPKWTGVMHGDEIPVVFGEPLIASKGYLPVEVRFSKIIMKYWANFAKTGDPNIGLVHSYLQPYWPLHTVFKREYMELGINSSMKIAGPRLRECAFWREYFPKISKLNNPDGHQHIIIHNNGTTNWNESEIVCQSLSLGAEQINSSSLIVSLMAVLHIILLCS